MATYKVLQDIEAEDKLLGPLTLKQFIFAAVALVCGYLSFLSVTRGASFLVAIFLPPMLFFGFMAFPWGKEQPTEIWLLAKLRFLIKPRTRIWDQSGLKELVTITAPKLDEKIYTNGLSEGEVKSRLQALANTIDSRGWAIKNVNVNLFAQPQAVAINSDRLIDLGSLPKEVADYEITMSDDILDEENNPTAQNLNRLINTSSATHRQQLIDQMKQGAVAQNQTNAQPADYWFMNQPAGQAPAGQAVFDNTGTIVPGTQPADDNTTQATNADEQALLNKIHSSKDNKSAAYGHMKTIDPLGSTSDAKTTSNPSAAPATKKAVNPAILELAKNDDLNISTIARQANKQQGQNLDDGEVVISLR